MGKRQDYKEKTDTRNLNLNSIAGGEELLRKARAQAQAQERTQKAKGQSSCDDDVDIEFTAATAILQMPELTQTGTTTDTLDADSETDDVNLRIKSAQIKMKRKMIKHYSAKAKELEENVCAILNKLKTNNTAIQNQFNQIRRLLSEHAQGKKKQDE